MRRTTLSRATAVLAAGAALTLASTPASGAPRQAPTPQPATLAADSADGFVAGAAAAATLRRAAGDELKRTGVLKGASGLQYVTYARTYRGLDVVGGDVVVTTDSAGAVQRTAVAQKQAIAVGTSPAISATAAVRTARKQVKAVTSATPATLKVLAWGTPKLAWETTVTGRTAEGVPSRLTVFVDARTGAVLSTRELVREGTGEGFYYKGTTLDTTGSGGQFTLVDPARPGLQCGGQDGAAFTGPDDAWGDGSGTDLETACADALYGAQTQAKMLKEWLGRDGVKGDGGSPPIKVGLDQVNAYWDGTTTNFGHSQDGQRQITPIDVVAHEMGHAIFQHTPGGAGDSNENGGINEATGDIFGALTEAYAKNAADTPDYEVGEEADLVGQGPIRYMHDPSKIGDPNCFTELTPDTEVHAGAGPLNHWFYLASEGSAPTNGQPASPTCNDSTVTGVGIQKAGKIYHEALLSKTSTWTHADIRVATLTAAKADSPEVCASIKAAWDAIAVPAQSGEPACG